MYIDVNAARSACTALAKYAWTWIQFLTVEFVITWFESIEFRIACFILLLQCSTFLFVWIIVQRTQPALQYVAFEGRAPDKKGS